jgi:hypothetical protein
MVDLSAFGAVKREAERLRLELDILRNLLSDADDIARRRGEEHGLCDAIDNEGQPYQSEGLASRLRGERS